MGGEQVEPSNYHESILRLCSGLMVSEVEPSMAELPRIIEKGLFCKFDRNLGRFGLPAAIFLIIWDIPALAKSSDTITAKAAIVIEKKTNRIVYAKNQRLKLPIASTAKIMTSLLVLENLDLESSTEISYQASQIEPSKVYLRKGEEWKNIHLLYALLMSSANDATVGLAEEIAGNEKKFVELMNKRALRLNMSNTNFTDSTGLSSKGQFSTCLDLTKVWRQASRYAVFREIMRSKHKIITSNSGRGIHLRNHNKLLWMYPQLFIVKTGYTLKAKHCFIGELYLSNKNYIVVILGAKKPWQDLKTLADFCLNRK